MLRRTKTLWNPDEGAGRQRGWRWYTPPRLLSLFSFSSSASDDPADHGCSCSGPRRWHTGSGWMPCIAWCRRRSRCGKSRRRRSTCPVGRWRWQDSWSRSLPVCRIRPGTRDGSCCLTQAAVGEDGDTHEEVTHNRQQDCQSQHDVE